MSKKIEIVCADCWSPGERRVKAGLEFIKRLLFYPLIFVLDRLGVSADGLSYFSALVGLVSVVYMWIDLSVAGGLLFLSLLIDGFDGTLARAQKKSGVRGAVLDSFTDQVVISATGIGFIALGLLDVVVGGMYLVLYPVLIVFSILRNIVREPRFFVFRPRIYVYATFWIYVIWGINFFDVVVGLAVVAILMQVILDFYFLKSRLV